MSMQNQILHKDYTSYGGTFQPSLPLNFEFQIKKDDPVRLLLHCIHQMDLTPLYRSFRRAERNLVSPHQLLAILIYAYMNQIYSSRRIEEVCLRDIHFMYLLEGRPAPDHTTIARFRRDHFAPCAKEILAQMAQLLASVGAISFENLFVDGTKIEAVQTAMAAKERSSASMATTARYQWRNEPRDWRLPRSFNESVQRTLHGSRARKASSCG